MRSIFVHHWFTLLIALICFALLIWTLQGFFALRQAFADYQGLSIDNHTIFLACSSKFSSLVFSISWKISLVLR